MYIRWSTYINAKKYKKHYPCNDNHDNCVACKINVKYQNVNTFQNHEVFKADSCILSDDLLWIDVKLLHNGRKLLIVQSVTMFVCIIRIPMLWVYGHFRYFTLLVWVSTLDPLKSVPALKGLKIHTTEKWACVGRSGVGLH